MDAGGIAGTIRKRGSSDGDQYHIALGNLRRYRCTESHGGAMKEFPDAGLREGLALLQEETNEPLVSVDAQNIVPKEIEGQRAGKAYTPRANDGNSQRLFPPVYV